MSPRPVSLKPGHRAEQQRDHRYRSETSGMLRDLAGALHALADALEADDPILGPLAGEMIANLLPALPKNVRDVFAENVTDDAARGYRADRLYEEMERAAADEASA